MQTRKKFFPTIFSKTALFSAAALFAVPATLFGYAGDITVGDTQTSGEQGGIAIKTETNNTTITVVNTANISGAILDKNGAVSDSDDGLTDYVLSENSTLTFTGGGTVEYIGGTNSGLDYYTGYYQLTRNATSAAKDNEVWNAWKDLDSFWSNGVYTGKVVVEGGTTLSLVGQLTQYVELYQTSRLNDDDAASRQISGYIGVSGIELKGDSTLSFEGSELNLVSSRPSMGSTTPTSGYNPTGVLSLNFVNNLKSDSSSVVVIGNDEESRNRIVFNADEDGDDASVVGVLRGNGRIYTTGEGTISFVGKTQLDCGTVSGDTTGDLWKSGTRLADVILGTATVNIGKTSATSTTEAVDNVFANATAVHLVSGFEPGGSSTLNTTDGMSGSAVVGTTDDFVNGGANYVGDFGVTTGIDSVTVNVYGAQVFNNFQSLWVERTELLSVSGDDLQDLSGWATQVYEPVKFAYKDSNDADRYSCGMNTEVTVQANSVLTIKQEVGRDGRYEGTIDTYTHGGLVVKTGEGRIYYSGTSVFYDTENKKHAALSNLRIEGGEWIQTGISDSARVTIAKTGSYRIIVSELTSTDFQIEATDATSELILSRSYLLENGLSTSALEAVNSGTALTSIDEDERYRQYDVSGDITKTAGLQITTQQNMFYGAVLVEDSLQLTLGGSTSSKSVFANASEIVLNGAGTGPYNEQNQYSTLRVRGTQIVRNLKGDDEHSAVVIEDDSTLVLTRTSGSTNTYTGGFSGKGNLVLLGEDSPISHNLNGELSGALVLLTGSTTVTQTNTNTGFSALVLKSGTSVSFTNSSRVGALIGESGSAVNITGEFIVGGNAGNATADGNGSYFATSDYSSYSKYFNGTGLDLYTTLDTAAVAARQIRDSSGKASVEGTKNYVKNPAELVYTRETSKNNSSLSSIAADGAFREVFTSTGTDATGADVFAKMKESDTSNRVFKGKNTVTEWLKAVFTNGSGGVSTELTSFLDSAAANSLSDSQKTELVELASTIAGSVEGVNLYLDGNGNINTVGWNKIVAAGGLEYFKNLDTDGKLDSMTDDSLYSFITAYYANYGFVLTEAVAAQISAAYGVDSNQWVVNGTANYDALYESFGVSSLEFAGTLFGSGSLIKKGAETLSLTGSTNSFTGSTQVQEGELYTTRLAIKSTSGVSVASGALLTISANKSDEKVQDLWSDVVETWGDDYSEYLENNEARLTGLGTVLKIGDGNVDLGNALLDVKDGNDFKGDFVIYDGALQVEVDAQNRELNGNPLEFDVYFSTAESGVTTAPQFDLVFSTTPNGSVATELDFTGKISGTSGTLTLDAKTTIDFTGATVGNNILNITNEATKSFSVGTIVLKTGALKFSAPQTSSSSNSSSLFSTVKMGAGTDLMFDMFDATSGSVVEANLTINGASIAKGDSDTRGNLIVAGKTTVDKITGKTTTTGGTLTLQGTTLGGIRNIVVRDGATLKFLDANGSSSATRTKVDVDSISTEAGTTLNIDGYDITVSEENTVLAGALKGSGALNFTGTTLTLGSTIVTDATKTISDAFSGTISVKTENGSAPKDATINFVAGDAQTVTYTGLAIESDATASEQKGALTLQKTGAGTVAIKNNSEKSNKLSAAKFAFDVQEGELQISGCILESSMSGLLSTNITEGATLRFVDDFGSFASDTNSSMIFKNISGAGTLAFDSSTTSTAINVSEFSSDTGTAFTGVVEISANTTLTLSEDITEFAALAGKGTVTVKSDDFTIRTDANKDGSKVFEGTLNLNNNSKTLNIVGEGVAAFSKDAISSVTTINIGSATENGGVGISSEWSGTVNAQGETSRVVVLNGSSSASSAVKTTATVKVSENVKNLKLSGAGEITLGGTAVATAFNLKDSNGNALDLSGNTANVPAVELSNVAGSSLSLKNLSELSAEKFALRTNDSSNEGIVFTGTGTASAASVGVWTTDITGDGNVVVSEGAELTLTANTLSFTGETRVENSTLIYAAASGASTVSSSSKLVVDGTSTVQGGVDLVAENASVEFTDGATFVFTGNAIRFTGTATTTGTLNVKLDSAALSVRGTPVSILEHTGNPDVGGNKILFDDIKFETTGARYYKDTADTAGVVIYVATDDLATVPGVSYHKGVDSKYLARLSTIATPKDGELDPSVVGTVEGALAEAIIKTPNSTLAQTVTNLTPLSYAAMPALMQSGFLSDISTVSSRIEQRRYDNYATFIWEIKNDWEFFAQAQGTINEADNATDTRVFDLNTYGAIAGMDVKLSATSVAGFALSYDYGKADIHDGGGDITAHDIRATGFFGALFAERFYLDLGAQVGYASFDVSRDTVLGTADGSANGFQGGAFATLGTLLPLWLSEDEKSGLNLMPYVGLAFSYFNVGSVDESGAGTALDVDSFNAMSLRASIGASLVWTTQMFDKNARVNLDLAYSRELGDDETDIDYKAHWDSTGADYSVSAPTFASDTFAIGPRFSVELSRDTSVYAGYRFEATTDSDLSHSANIGFRTRF